MNSWREHYWHTVPCVRARIEEIISRADCAGLSVLEAGCNEGFLSMALKEAGGVVTSLDNDPAMIAKAKEYFNIDAIQGDINALPFPDKSFDIAIGGEVLEHVPNPGLALGELFRVSKGRVIISLPLGAYWLGEPTHLWKLEGITIKHDCGSRVWHDKEIIILEFNIKE